ncbi:unnamed protein product [Pedinophyceae sp. YPF-701]|nr:unnamed protein product [Pedinophyceae sp. YPF-701]
MSAARRLGPKAKPLVNAWTQQLGSALTVVDTATGSTARTAHDLPLLQTSLWWSRQPPHTTGQITKGLRPWSGTPDAEAQGRRKHPVAAAGSGASLSRALERSRDPLAAQARQADIAASKSINKRIVRARTIAQVLALLDEMLPQNGALPRVRLNAVNVSTALHRLARAAHEAGSATGGGASAGLTDASGRSMGARAAAHAARLNAMAAQLLRDMDAQGISNLMWANATLRRTLGPTTMDAAFQTIADELVAHLGTGPGGAASGQTDPGQRLWEAVVAEAWSRPQSRFCPQAVANMLWALSALQHAPPAGFLRDFTAAAAEVLPDFAPQHLSISLYACATMDFLPPREFLDGLSEQSVFCMSGFKPQELSNLVWALSKLGIRDARILDAVAAVCRTRFGADQTSALASARRPQHAANILWAFATLRHHPGPRALSALISDVSCRLHELRPADLAALVWACAELGEAPGVLVGALRAFLSGGGAGEAAAGCGPHSLSTLLWGLGVMGALDAPLWARFVGAVDDAVPRCGASDAALLYEAALLTHSSDDDHGGLEQLSDASVSAAHAGWISSGEPALQSADCFHMDVFGALSALGVAFEPRWRAADGSLRGDAALVGPDGSLKKVLLLDNARMFCVNVLKGEEVPRPLGKAIARRRTLEHYGYGVVSLPYWAWDALSADARVDFLRLLLVEDASAGEALACLRVRPALRDDVSEDGGQRRWAQYVDASAPNEAAEQAAVATANQQRHRHAMGPEGHWELSHPLSGMAARILNPAAPEFRVSEFASTAASSRTTGTGDDVGERAPAADFLSWASKDVNDLAHDAGAAAAIASATHVLGSDEGVWAPPLRSALHNGECENLPLPSGAFLREMQALAGGLLSQSATSSNSLMADIVFPATR